MKKVILSTLCITSNIANTEAMDPPPSPSIHTPITTISHHFLVDAEKREIGFIKKKGKLFLPSCQVLDTERSNHAIKDYTKKHTGLSVSDMFLVGKIECSPEKEKKIFTFSDFLSLFGIVVSDSPQPLPQNSTKKIIHMYYLSLTSSENQGLYWVSIPDIYQHYGKPEALTIDPEETVDILKLMTNFRQNKKFDLKTDIPSISQHFLQNKIRVDVDIYIPVSLQNEYFSGRADLQTEKAQKQQKVSDSESLILAPVGLALAGMYITKTCTIQ